MNRLQAFIGQRVKLVRPLHPEYLGIEGNIHSFDAHEPGEWFHDGMLDSYTDCTVDWDIDKPPCHRLQRLEQLEPVLPDGAQPSEFTTVEELLESLQPVTVE